MRTLRSAAVLSAMLVAGPVFSAQIPGFGRPSRYEPNWESIRRHPLPEWFNNAKLGIFIHWGLYSVPAWAPPSGELGKVNFNEWFIKNPYAEWYANTLRIKDSPTYKHHLETYGENYGYYSFAAEFQRDVAKWNPDDWARLFKDAGARYVVLTTKHHDGFTLWPSRVANPRLEPDQRSSKRDLVGELTAAVRGQGLHMGLYYSGGLDWTFEPGPIKTFADLMKTVPQSEEYAKYADAQWRELIERYNPDVLWNDINYPKKGDLLGIMSEYYTKHPDGVVNNRFGVDWTDFTTPEYSKYDKIVEKKWESCRGLGFSFGYNRNEGPEHVLSSEALVRLFVDIVSKNGNLLLNIGPRPDGSISDIQLDRLRALGRWLRTNGDAIFDTHPWIRPSTKTSDGIDVRFTRKGDAAYAILLDKPKGAEVTIQSLFPAENMTVQLLGAPGNLQWTHQEKDVTIALPASLPGEYAWVFRLTPVPYQVVRESARSGAALQPARGFPCSNPASVQPSSCGTRGYRYVAARILPDPAQRISTPPVFGEQRRQSARAGRNPTKPTNSEHNARPFRRGPDRSCYCVQRPATAPSFPAGLSGKGRTPRRTSRLPPARSVVARPGSFRL